MADIKKIATRDSYGRAVKELAAQHKDLIVFDADLAGATKTSVFQKEYPDRHFDCGIAEGNMMAAAARDCGKIITCEEHSVIGGLGEAVCALLSEKRPTPVKRIGVNDEFGHSGPAAALLKEVGLSAEHIVEVAKGFCS